MDLVRTAPSKLIEDLRRGRFDAALVSSIEAFRRPGYRAVAGLGISCRGAVRSVRAFRRPGAPVRSIALDSSSATSVALLRILLARIQDCSQCTYEVIDPDLHPDRRPEELLLLIGDCGLRADPGQREVLDLGALWYELTGLPFVFALWLLAPGADGDALASRLLLAAREGAEAGLDDGTAGAVHYTLGPEELLGLGRFRQEAAALDLARGDLELTFVGGSTLDSGSAPGETGTP